MKITTKLLKSKGACAEQVKLFAELFPQGVVPTEELCVRHAQLFNWNWAASNLLSAPARAEYAKVCAAARAEFDKVCAAAAAEYDKVCASAGAEFDKVYAPARAEFDKARASAGAEYDKARAKAFFAGWRHDRAEKD